METETAPMQGQCPAIELPILDGRTREGRHVLDAQRELAQKLGTTPSFEGRRTAAQVLRAMFSIALLDRKRAETGSLSDFDAEMVLRHENTLARALKRLERHTSAQKAKFGLADHLARTYGPAGTGNAA